MCRSIEAKIPLSNIESILRGVAVAPLNRLAHILLPFALLIACFPSLKVLKEWRMLVMIAW